MGGLHVRLLCAAVLSTAAIPVLLREAVAQLSEGTLAAAKRAARTPIAGEQEPRDAAEPEVERRRHIGKVHDLRRRLKEHHQRERNANPDASDPYVQYLQFTKELEKHGLTIQFQPTVMTQWGTPSGGPLSTQVILNPTITWQLPDSAIGQGTITFNYMWNRYYAGGQSGASLQSRLNALDPINDSAVSNRVFNQLTYEHDFPGNVLMIGVGQFPLSNYDSSTYTQSQQLSFISYSTSQNATQTYPTASLGTFMQITPIANTLDFVVGFQDASNIPGNNIQFATATSGPYTAFAYGLWTPTISGLGRGYYSFLYYHQPSVPLQPAVSDGWSLNVSQDLPQNWGLFVRANATTGPLSPIKDSVVGGFVYKNIFGRDYDNDQLGVGVARNGTNMDAFVGQNVRASEWVVEAYLNRVIAKAWIFGPDVQFYIRPALNPAQASAQVFTLRLTGLF
jgi:hypothetical protein